MEIIATEKTPTDFSTRKITTEVATMSEICITHRVHCCLLNGMYIYNLLYNSNSNL